MAYTAYSNIIAPSLDDLQALVTAAIAANWQPLGEVVIQTKASAAQFPTQYIQTMVQGTSGGGSGGDITASQITDSTVVGRAVLTAADAPTALAAIGGGTSNLELGTTSTTALAGNTAIPAPATVAPVIAGTAAVGTSTLYARQDHVHPAQTTVSGNAGTATALATARNISISGQAIGTATAFNGGSDIVIPITNLGVPTATARGAGLLIPFIADLTDAPTAADFNGLKNALVTAGLMAAS